MNVMIVLNYNDYQTTSEYLERIKLYNVLDKIVVVDNCSPDNSYDKLFKYQSDKIDVIKTEKNEGYAKGNNYGIFYAHKKYNISNLIISNPDIIVDEIDIINMISKLEEKDFFSITGLVYSKYNNLTRNFAWKTCTYMKLMIYNFSVLQLLFRKIFGYSKFYKKPIDNYGSNLMKVDNLPGCFVIFNFEKFEKIGFFSEKTFLYFEEDILFYYAKKNGYTSIVDLNSKIIHFEGETINKSISKYGKKEKIMRDSACEFLRIKKCPRFFIALYRLINYIFVPERYIYKKIQDEIRRRG